MNFLQDLKRGQQGEAAFYQNYQTYITRTGGRSGDFIINETGESIELKSDSYDPLQYENFIIERYSSPGKPGGPWQALAHGCKYFAYQFIQTGEVFLFETADLVTKLEQNSYKEFFCNNGAYQTTYYKVPRADYECIRLNTRAVLTAKKPLAHSLLASSNLDYHGDRTHLSSSNLKTLLKSPEQFYNEWILGDKEPQKENPNFSEGSFIHSLVLEPDQLDQYAIFPGLRKAGPAWEEFKALNPSKTILSAAQVNRCEQLYKGYASTKLATQLMEGTIPEHTMLAKILDVPIKTRADAINVQKRYIVDVKTTAMPTSIDAFRATVVQYSYELSAALYCEAARETYGELFDFYWLVLSKKDGKCSIYKASSDTLSQGAAMYTQALVMYKKCKASGIWRKEQPEHDFDHEIEEI